jgi:hypothetical protein
MRDYLTKEADLLNNQRKAELAAEDARIKKQSKEQKAAEFEILEKERIKLEQAHTARLKQQEDTHNANLAKQKLKQFDEDAALFEKERKEKLAEELTNFSKAR